MKRLGHLHDLFGEFGVEHAPIFVGSFEVPQDGKDFPEKGVDLIFGKPGDGLKQVFAEDVSESHDFRLQHECC